MLKRVAWMFFFQKMENAIHIIVTFDAQLLIESRKGVSV